MKLCAVCGKEAYSPRAKYCNDCLVEYAVFKAVREGRLKPVKEGIIADNWEHVFLKIGKSKATDPNG